jgi:hypothetical protein
MGVLESSVGICSPSIYKGNKLKATSNVVDQIEKAGRADLNWLRSHNLSLTFYFIIMLYSKMIYNVVLNSANRLAGTNAANAAFNFDWLIWKGAYELTFSFNALRSTQTK